MWGVIFLLKFSELISKGLPAYSVEQVNFIKWKPDNIQLIFILFSFYSNQC